MKRILLLSTAMFSMALTGTAQMGFGVEAGFNVSNYNVLYHGAMKETSFRNGGRFGVMSDMALTDNLYFQPGICYVTTGYRNNIAGGYQQMTVKSVEIPLFLQYKIGMLGTDRLFLGAGPFIGWNKDGNNYLHTATIDSRSDIKIGSKVGDGLRPIDIGAGINVGYQLTAGLVARLRGQMGFMDLDPTGLSDMSIRSYSFCVSAGYMFYMRDKSGKMKINRDRSAKKNK